MKLWRIWVGALAMAVGAALPIHATVPGPFSASIAAIQIDSSGFINVYFASSTDCGSNRLTYVNSIIGNEDAKAMLVVLLSWQAQQKGVNFNVTGCTGNYGQFNSAYNQ